MLKFRWNVSRLHGMASTERATCGICPHNCTRAEGETGICGARRARGGIMECDNYGILTALALDPIEKKPLARFYPGSMILSAGSYGCNLKCWYCQNWDIAQQNPVTAQDHQPETGFPILSAEKLVQKALSLESQNNIGIAFTYNEPCVGYEYVLDTSKAAKSAGLKTVLVSNGFVNPVPFDNLIRHIDAANIDLKCFSEQGYNKLGGKLAPVLRNIQSAYLNGLHLEITTLVVPGLSSRPEEMDKQARWLADISPDIPLHINRYFPRWKATEPPTDIELIYNLAEIAGRHLNYVYTGNC